MKRLCVLGCFFWIFSFAEGGLLGQRQEVGGVEQRVKLLTVMLQACGRPGAGVVVRKDKQWIYLLTAYHVAYDDASGEACQSGKVRFLSRSGVSGEIPFKITGGADVKEDLAAIKVGKAQLANVPLHFTFTLARDPSTLRRGDHLFMVGFVNEIGRAHV